MEKKAEGKDVAEKKRANGGGGDEKRVSFNAVLEEMEEEEEGMEERELSYELFQAPAEQERQLGTIIKDTFGFYKKRPDCEEDPEKPGSVAQGVVHRYTLSNAQGLEVRLMTLGATILSIRMPDNKNIIGDVLLGFEELKEYMDEKKNLLAFGSIFGRYSSIISNAQIKIGKQEYVLSTNVRGIHHFGGGFRGFDKVLWDSHVAYDRVIMSHVSPDGDEGYPGTLMVQVSFQLTQNNRLIVNTTATTSKPTILSLGHNLYLNMAGHERGPDGLKEHTLLVNADRFVKINEFTKTPEETLEEVGATYFDLRVPRPIWKAMRKIPGGGYNNTFCLTKGSPPNSVSFAGRLVHPNSGRYLEVITDMPGLHINTGTNLPDPEAKPPLEAQTGFTEDHGYPQFCRDMKKLAELANELENELPEKQTWPRQDPALPKPEIIEEIKPEAPNENPEEKMDVARKLSQDKGPGEGAPKKRMSQEKDEDEDKEEDLNDNESEKLYEKFLKDDALSDNEETKVPAWKPPEPIYGKMGAAYKKNGAVCLMTQEFPDCMKFADFPKPIVKPGETYSRTTIYKFGIIPLRRQQEKYFYL